jgi:hypothetical protein
MKLKAELARALQGGQGHISLLQGHFSSKELTGHNVDPEFIAISLLSTTVWSLIEGSLTWCPGIDFSSSNNVCSDTYIFLK